MDRNTANAIGGVLAGAAVLAATVNSDESEQKAHPNVVKGVAVPVNSTETTVRESVGGTVTKTTKEVKDGKETTTTTVTRTAYDGSKETTTKTISKPAAATVKKTTRIQNETGNVRAYGPGVAVQVDRRKVVRPEEEGRCIVIQLRSTGCCRPQFNGEFERDIFTDLTADDFYDILDQINEQYHGCCPPFACCGNSSRRAAAIARLNKQYAHKKISMRLERRTEVYTNLAADLSGDPNATPVEKKFLVIRQL